MAKQTFRIEGLSELKEALTELPKATGTNTQKRALTKAGELIEATAESLAPVFKGGLKKSITVGTKLSGRQKSQHKKESKVEVFVGPGSMTRAITQEFGTYFHRPHPFMRPAWEQQKMNALESIKDLLAEEIEKARARLARKAAKLLQSTK